MADSTPKTVKTQAALFDLTTVHYCYVLKCLCLFLATLSTFHLHIDIVSDEKLRPLTLLGYLVSHHVLTNSVVFIGLQTFFYVFALLWVLQKYVPWSGLGAALTYTGIVSAYTESLIYTHHQHHVVNMLLIVFAAWQFFYQSEIRAANEAGEYFQRRLCPKWVFLLCTVYLALTYSFSGMTKLWFHGPGWANGTSLQTWVIGADGWPRLAEFIRQNRTIAAWMQFAVLWAEALAIFAIWWRWPRLIIGLALIGFHLTSEVLFQYGFYGNIVAIAFLFIIPSIWSIEADSFLAWINQQNSERKTPVE